MALRFGKGFKRLAITLSVLWVGWWAVQAFESYNYIKSEKAHYVHSPGDLDAYQAGLALAMGELETDLILMVSLPIALALIYWVYRGLKRGITPRPN